jgi:hypothetical protein
VFDLRERVLPAGTDVRMPSEDEFLRHLVMMALGAQGLATAQEISYQRHISNARLIKVLNEMCEAGEIIAFDVEGIPDEVYYGLKDIGDTPAKAGADEVHILSPFDNLVIQRKRLSRLFGYDYQIECYVPEPKRKFGYFCLPLLRGTDFLGRVDVKADRQVGALRLESFHWEHPTQPPFRHRDAIVAALKNFALFNACAKLIGLDKLKK